ncbi:hypothetical protein V1502_09475 [Bacillus sp. SCS-153A]|uniref:hypothetical protein n=1 Tax=Rossellomorea sedimentorum TaxID=3115294 RepID=UPI003905AC15
MTSQQKRTVLLLMLVSTFIGIVIRLFDVSRSTHELVSFHNLDILILLFIMACSGGGLLLMKAVIYPARKQR